MWFNKIIDEIKYKYTLTYTVRVNYIVRVQLFRVLVQLYEYGTPVQRRSVWFRICIQVLD